MTGWVKELAEHTWPPEFDPEEAPEGGGRKALDSTMLYSGLH